MIQYCSHFLNGTKPPPFPINTFRFAAVSSSNTTSLTPVDTNVTTSATLHFLRHRLQTNLRNTSQTAERPCKFNRWVGEACKWYVGYDKAMKEFGHSTAYWDDELRTMAVHVVNPCFTTHSMGNDFGMYAESLLCAKLSGAHLIAPIFTDPEAAAITESSPFYRAIPKMLLNDNAQHRAPNATAAAMAALCRTDAFPWEERDALLHTPAGVQHYIALFVTAVEDVLLAIPGPAERVAWKRGAVVVYTPHGLETRRFRRHSGRAAAHGIDSASLFLNSSSSNSSSNSSSSSSST